MAFLSGLFTVFCGAVPPVLLCSGLYYTVRLRAFPFLHPGRVGRALFPRGGDGAASRRACAMALSGTVGVGNMAGVSLALLTGGPGSIFWMWICAAFAMILKFAEITLAMDSREKKADGSYSGGMAQAMRRTGWRRAGGAFAALSVGYTLLVGAAVQANATAECLSDGFSLSPWVSGLVLLCISLPVIAGGGKKISAWTAYLVPVMCVLYVGATLFVICRFGHNLGPAFRSIFAGAFSGTAGAGGVFGFLVSRAARVGASRGLMSNEGGCGTSPMAHITAGEVSAAGQGLFGLLEVAVDTWLICTLTALSILCAFPALPTGVGGMALLRMTLGTVFGPAGGVLLALCLSLFAYATILCTGFYGQVSMAYLTPSSGARLCYFILFATALLWGAVSDVGAVWRLLDILLSAMTYLNLAFLWRRADRVVTLSRSAGYI